MWAQSARVPVGPRPSGAGVDISPAKIELINQGKSPIVEPGLEQLLQDGVSKGRLRGTTDVQAAILASDLSLLCVGTPSKKNGDLDLVYMEAVCREIGTALRDKANRHTVVVRSTVLPGTVKNVVVPILEQYSGKKPASTSAWRSTRNSSAKARRSRTTTSRQ